MRSWKRRNPEYEFRLYDDADIEHYVQEHYSAIMPAFKTMKPVQKADVFRYVVIYNEGGVYADIDTWDSVPVRNWTSIDYGAPHAFDDSEADSDPAYDLIIGFEAVQKKPGWEKHYAAEFQLCQWTFAAAPKHPLLDLVLKRIIKYYDEGNHLRSKSIIKSTGPGIWSYTIHDAISSVYGVQFGKTKYFDHDSLAHRGAKIQTILLLPTRSFGRPYGGIGSANGVLVWHGFQGSWKPSISIGRNPEGPYIGDDPFGLKSSTQHHINQIDRSEPNRTGSGKVLDVEEESEDDDDDDDDDTSDNVETAIDEEDNVSSTSQFSASDEDGDG